MGEDGFGQLVAVNSGKCLEVNGTDSKIDQWTCIDGATNELWRPVTNPAGGISLEIESSSHYLGVDVSETYLGTVGSGTKLVLQATQSATTSWATYGEN